MGNDQARGAPVPVGISARHIHLSNKHMKALFGEGQVLTAMKDLSQPGQYAAHQTLTVAGPRGALEKVRILGPLRKETQVELAPSDCRAIGLTAPVRESGDLAGSAGVVLLGPGGSVILDSGAIIAARHVHMTPMDSQYLGLNDRDLVSVRLGAGSRTTVYENVVIRVNKDFRLELHIDTDEANAAGCSQGDMAWILGHEASAYAPPSEPARFIDLTDRRVVTEEDVLTAAKRGLPILAAQGSIITPLAVDAKRKHAVELIFR